MRLFVDGQSTNNLIYEHSHLPLPLLLPFYGNRNTKKKKKKGFRRWVFVEEIVRRLPIYEQSHLRTLLSEIVLSLSSLPLAVKKKKKNSNRKRTKKKDGVRR